MGSIYENQRPCASGPVNVLPGNKKLGFIVLPSHKIIMLNSHALLKTLNCMNGRLGDVNSNPGQLSVHVDHLFPYHMTGAGNAHPLLFGGHGFLFKLSLEHCFAITKN
jgi:hypothetical protein